MSGWNYRRICERYNDGTSRVFVGEAYYNEDGEFNGGYSDSYDGMVSAETPEELATVVEKINLAMTKPILDVKVDGDKDYGANEIPHL